MWLENVYSTVLSVLAMILLGFIFWFVTKDIF